MRLDEILKTGAAFIQRKEWGSPLATDSEKLTLSKEDLFADDWIVPEREVVVSRGDLEPLWEKIVRPSFKGDADQAFNEFCKAIGVDTQ